MTGADHETGTAAGIGSAPVIGTAGWAIPLRSAALAPGEGSHLERFSRVFGGAEINASFYRSPRASTWLRWADSVPPSFRFAVKAPKTITHEQKLDCPPEALAAFLAEARLLGHRLGPLLFQLPPKLAFEGGRAHRFFEMLRSSHSGPVALEPRHPTWFTPETELLCSEHKISRVAADPVVGESGLRPGGWSGLVYYRLHGWPRRYYSSYPEEFLNMLRESIRAHSPSAEVWCIFDNTASGAALDDAARLLELLGQPV